MKFTKEDFLAGRPFFLSDSYFQVVYRYFERDNVKSVVLDSDLSQAVYLVTEISDNSLLVCYLVNGIVIKRLIHFSNLKPSILRMPNLN